MFRTKKAGLFILCFLATAVSIFTMAPLVSAGAEDGLDDISWINGNNTAVPSVKSIDWSTRLTFLSPTRIQDKTTGVIYQTTADIFDDRNETYLRDGSAGAYYWYRPLDDSGNAKEWTTTAGSECMGVIVWFLHGDGTKSELYLVQPQRTSDNTSCRIGDKNLSDDSRGDVPEDERYHIVRLGENDRTPDNWDGDQAHVRNAVAPFYWANQDKIAIFDSDRSFTLATGANRDTLAGYWADNASDSGVSDADRADIGKWEFWKHSNCENEFLVTAIRQGSAPAAGYFVNEDGDNMTISSYPCVSGRDMGGNGYGLINYDGKSVSLGFPRNGVLAADQVDPNETGLGATGGEALEDNSCESNSGVLGWIMCPVAGLLDNITGWLDGQIQRTLIVKDDYFIGESGDRLKAAWAQIRNVAYIILIPIMLVMVIGTALGFEVFSAYTVKKALPRMVIAVIFITFSWYICVFLINLFNVMGTGVKGLITFPFSAVNDDQGLMNGMKGALQSAGIITGGNDGAAELGVGALGLVAVGSAFIAGALSLGIIMSLLFSAALILGIVFIVLIARQLFILASLLLAPLAILAWIFPGNDKFWKLWWNSFSKLLMMFPLIMAIIGIGQIFAFVAGNANEGEAQLVTAILVVAATIIPYALIPFTFKFAGGLFANLAGVVNDRNKGLLDRGKKKRTEERARLKNLAGMNKRFNPNSRIGSKFNGAAGWLADPKNSAKIKFNTPGGRALAAELTQKSAQQSQDLAKWLSTSGFNQEALTAIMQNVQANKGKFSNSMLKEQIATLSQGTTQERAAAGQLQSYGGFLNNTFNSEEYGRANVGMAAGLAKAQQGFLDTDDENEIANYSNFLNGMSPGLGDTFKTQAGLMNAQAGGLTKVGYSEQVDKDGKIVAGGTAARAIQMSRTSVQEFAGAKASALKKHFIGKPGETNSTLDTILNTAEGKDIVDPISGEKLPVTTARKRALLETMAQAAYGYNTPAETAEALQGKLKELVGTTEMRKERVTGRDGTVREVEREVATTEIGRWAQDAMSRASRDPSLFGGLDAAPPPKE